MNDWRPCELEDQARAALALMEQALELLDRCGAGLDAGAYLDLAICRLRERLQRGDANLSDADTFGALDPSPLPWSNAS